MSLDPREGLGYALGWCAAALALVASLAYSWRRRFSSAHRYGRMPLWMRAHMALALLSLACAVAHAGGMGFGNAQVTMILMLTVTASGLIGRYLKTRSGVMFNWWHAAHLPLVFLLFACIIVHVVFSYVY